MYAIFKHFVLRKSLVIAFHVQNLFLTIVKYVGKGEFHN